MEVIWLSKKRPEESDLARDIAKDRERRDPKYPNLVWHPPKEGRTHVIFLGRKPGNKRAYGFGGGESASTSILISRFQRGGYRPARTG